MNWVETDAYDQIDTEEWSEVTLNADMPNSLFAWQPPKGWTEWRFPETSENDVEAGRRGP